MFDCLHRDWPVSGQYPTPCPTPPCPTSPYPIHPPSPSAHPQPQLRLDTKRLCFAIFEQSKATGTMDVIWGILIWSLESMYNGTWPSAHWDGTPYAAGTAEAVLAGSPLAGGFFAIPFLVKGDWEHFTKTFGLRHSSSNQPCDFCRCQKGKGSDPRDWPNNFNRNARWKSGLLSPNAWRELNGGHMHMLFKHFAFLSNANVAADEMHVMHLGVSQAILGSVLHMLVYQILPGRPLQNMERIWTEICGAYRDGGMTAQFSSLGLSSFCDPAAPNFHYPRLKGKAAEIKHLFPAIMIVWDRHMDRNSDEQKLVFRLLEEQQHLQDLIDEDATAFHMEQASSRDVCRVVDLVLSLYSRLASSADNERRLLWNVLPKHHALWHFARQAAFLHPRRGACYQDEDFMGRVKGVVQSCTAATPLHQIPNALLKKYRWGMYFQYLTSS